MMKKTSHRIRYFILVIVGAASIIFSSCEKDDNKEKPEIAGYVVLGVSDNQPSFTFPKETEEGYFSSLFTDLHYNNLNQVVSYNLRVSCPSDNVYNIIVSNIQRNNSGTPVSYKADIAATINGKVISGILYYP